MFLMRFDMRAPGLSGDALAEFYAQAVEMAAWGEENGCAAVVLSEHHASPDGYLPAPLILASAMAARTRRMPLQISALLLPLYDPVRVAEEIAVLDVISRGRVSYVLGMGYRPEEYEMFGVPMAGRGRRMERWVELLRQAWTGEPFPWEGRTVHVTPRPFTPGGPLLMLGGNTERAARRAARLGLGFCSQGGKPELEQIYLDECRAQGRDPGPLIVPPPGTITCAYVAEDLDEAWRELGPCMLHDARAYAEWASHGPAAVSHTFVDSVEALRAAEGAYRIFTPEQAAQYIRTHGMLVLHPLCGGAPPAAAWRSLELLRERVLPAVGAG